MTGHVDVDVGWKGVRKWRPLVGEEVPEAWHTGHEVGSSVLSVETGMGGTVGQWLQCESDVCRVWRVLMHDGRWMDG